jgi:hypothetical protein
MMLRYLFLVLDYAWSAGIYDSCPCIMISNADGRARYKKFPCITHLGRNDWQARYRIFMTVESGSRAATATTLFLSVNFEIGICNGRVAICSGQTINTYSEAALVLG